MPDTTEIMWIKPVQRFKVIGAQFLGNCAQAKSLQPPPALARADEILIYVIVIVIVIVIVGDVG